MVLICKAGDQLPVTAPLARFYMTCIPRLTLQDVETDSSQLVDVWMVNFGQEPDLGRCHGIVVWKEKFEFEDAPWEGVSGHHIA